MLKLNVKTQKKAVYNQRDTLSHLSKLTKYLIMCISGAGCSKHPVNIGYEAWKPICLNGSQRW